MAKSELYSPYSQTSSRGAGAILAARHFLTPELIPELLQQEKITRKPRENAEYSPEKLQNIENRRRSISELLKELLNHELDTFNPDMDQEQYTRVEDSILDAMLLSIPYYDQWEPPILQARLRRGGRDSLTGGEQIWVAPPQIDKLFGQYIDKSTAIVSALAHFMDTQKNYLGLDKVSIETLPKEKIPQHLRCVEEREMVLKLIITLKADLTRKYEQTLDVDTKNMLTNQIFALACLYDAIEHNREISDSERDEWSTVLSPLIDNPVPNARPSEYFAALYDVHKNISNGGLVDHHAIMARFAINTIETLQEKIRQKIANKEYLNALNVTDGETFYRPIPEKDELERVDIPKVVQKDDSHTVRDLDEKYQRDPSKKSPYDLMLEAKRNKGEMPVVEDRESLPAAARAQLEMWEKILAINPYIFGVYALLHDIGRLLTHDPIYHETEGEKIMEESDIDPLYVEATPMPWLDGEYLPEARTDVMNGYLTSEINPDIQHPIVMVVLMHFVDFFAKADSLRPIYNQDEKVIGYSRDNVRRPHQVLDVSKERNSNYGMQQDTSNPRFVYSEFERSIMQVTLNHLEDIHSGLGLSREEIMEIFENFENVIVPQVRSDRKVRQA